MNRIELIYCGAALLVAVLLLTWRRGRRGLLEIGAVCLIVAVFTMVEHFFGKLPAFLVFFLLLIVAAKFFLRR